MVCVVYSVNGVYPDSPHHTHEHTTTQWDMLCTVYVHVRMSGLGVGGGMVMSGLGVGGGMVMSGDGHIRGGGMVMLGLGVGGGMDVHSCKC